MAKKYYEILEISENATQNEIKKAYYKMALKYHPDKNPGGEAKFKEISEAYEILGNEDLRKRYDLGETNFTNIYDDDEQAKEQFKAYWDAKEKKLAEEVRLMEELLKGLKEREEIMKEIWVLNQTYLERCDISTDIRMAFNTTCDLLL